MFVIRKSFYCYFKLFFIGSVYKKYPGNKSVRKNINHTTIPDQEDIVTTKEVCLITRGLSWL